MLNNIATKQWRRPAATPEAVAQLRVAYEVSERRAFSTLRADRASVGYGSLRPRRDFGL
jgi:hypothetical protein